MNVLDIDGIVIRKIAPTRTAFYRDCGQPLLPHQTRVERNGHPFIESVEANSLGGKYLVMVESGQGATIMFSLKHDGIGDTPEAAYADYLEKSK